MLDGEFNLGGFRFGAGTQIRTMLDTGNRVLEDQDAQLDNRDGLVFGTDYESGPEWTFDFILKGGRGQGNFDLLRELRNAWEGSRSIPGQVDTLLIALPGRRVQVYGRPRRFKAGDYRDAWHHNQLEVAATFQLSDPLIYDQVERQLEIGLVPPQAGALTFPIRFPWTTAAASEAVSRFAANGGDAPTPVRATFYGPVTNPRLVGPGWTLGLNTTLAYDRSVTVDARARTVLRDDGASLAGAVSRRTYLEDLVLPEGTSELQYSGDDATGTSKVKVTWHDAYRSL